MTRLVKIPIIIWLYAVKEEPLWAVVVLTLSGATDVVDGYIARHFNMISELGKALDPVADKLTQLAILMCLIFKFPLMILPFVLLLVKEITTAILNLIVIKKTKKVHGAVCHGKATTVLLYLMMTLHIIWYDIPSVVSNIAIVLCLAMMSVSFVLYSLRNRGYLNAYKEESENTVS